MSSPNNFLFQELSQRGEKNLCEGSQEGFLTTTQSPLPPGSVSQTAQCPSHMVSCKEGNTWDKCQKDIEEVPEVRFSSLKSKSEIVSRSVLSDSLCSRGL